MDQYSAPAANGTTAVAAAPPTAGTTVAMPGYPVPAPGFVPGFPAPGYGQPTLGYPPAPGFPAQWYGGPAPAMAPMRPVGELTGGAAARSMNSRIAWFAGIGVLLVIGVIVLGLTRNSAENRNLFQLAEDGVATLRDLALYILGLVPR